LGTHRQSGCQGTMLGSDRQDQLRKGLRLYG
jgi:hypothetical protein